MSRSLQRAGSFKHGAVEGLGFRQRGGSIERGAGRYDKDSIFSWAPGGLLLSSFGQFPGVRVWRLPSLSSLTLFLASIILGLQTNFVVYTNL